jgi:hypothetical protein
MATQVNPLEAPAPSAKPGRRNSKTKEHQPEQVAPSDTDFPYAGQEADPQQELDTLENQADAPVRGSYLKCLKFRRHPSFTVERGCLYGASAREGWPLKPDGQPFSFGSAW